MTKAFEDDWLELGLVPHLAAAMDERARTALERAAYLLARSETREEVFATLTAAGIVAVGAARGVVMLLDETGDHLQLIGAVGYDEAYLEPWENVPVSVDTPVSRCVRTAKPVVIHSLADLRAQYPEVEPADEELRALIVFPLRHEGTVFGAWGLQFDTAGDQREPQSPNGGTMAAGERLTELAAARVASIESLQELLTRFDQLQEALTSRIVIEQAKGVLAERHHISVAEAFERLRGYSRNHGVRMHQLAESVVRGDIDPLAT